MGVIYFFVKANYAEMKSFNKDKKYSFFISQQDSFK